MLQNPAQTAEAVQQVQQVVYPIWYYLAIAIVGSLPATLTALAGVIYAIKVRSDVRSGQEKIEAKVDNVQKEVDGKHSLLIQAVRDMAQNAMNINQVAQAAPRPGRKTDVVIIEKQVGSE